MKKRERQKSESLEKAIEDAKQKHQQFLEETGIDLKALVASGFDANSGQPEGERVNSYSRNLFSEIVEGFEYLKQEREMKEQTGSFDVALRNMLTMLRDGKDSENESISSFCKMVLDSWDRDRGTDWYIQYMKEKSVQRFAEAAQNAKWTKLT